MPAERVGPYMTVTPAGEGWIVTARDGFRLGTVEWNPRWKCYELVPQQGGAFTASCCRDMATFLDRKTSERRARPGAQGLRPSTPRAGGERA